MVCNELAKQGIKADCVVVADDENLDIAKQYGFHTVERDNQFLGRRFNDGHEFAGKSGFDFSAPVGSDMFVDHKLFVGLKDRFTITNYYAVVRKDGKGMATLSADWGILQIIPRRLMVPLEFRPCAESVEKGCDSHTRNRIKNHNGRILELFHKEVHPFECVSFQSKQQITSFQGLVNTYKARVFQDDDVKSVIAPLRKWYPDVLLDKIVEYYQSGTSEKL
jgi:hypothetical protein